MKPGMSVSLCVVVLNLLIVAYATDDKDKLSAADIIIKHIAAVGGKEALSKIKSRVAIGTARKESDAAVPVAIMSEAPNRISAVYQFEGYNWQLTFDGTKPIFRPVFSRATAPLMQKYEDMLTTGTMFNDVSLYNVLLTGEDAGPRFEAKGTRKLKGKTAHVVEMKRPKGELVRMFFDTEAFMWVRTEYGSVRLTKPMGTFTNERTSKDEESTYDFYVETSDFRDVDGLKLPFRIEISATAPILKQKNLGSIVTTITEYRHNVQIDPKMFQ